MVFVHMYYPYGMHMASMYAADVALVTMRPYKCHILYTLTCVGIHYMYVIKVICDRCGYCVHALICLNVVNKYVSKAS